MVAENSIGLSDFTNLLDSGALLRKDPETWFLLRGPFVVKNSLQGNEVGLYHPDFFLDSSERLLIPQAFYQLTTEDLEELCHQWLATQKPPASAAVDWQAADLQDFEVSFTEIQRRLRQGPLTKAVPIVFETSAWVPSPADRVKMLLSLLKAPSRLFIYGNWDQNRGLLGATPEILLRRKGSILQTMALAGTCPRDEVSQRVSLLEDPKERHEHELVAQDLLQALQAYGSVHSTGPQILELPTLYHLKTDLECRLKSPQEFSFFKACRSLHPTPALGVAPRSYGLEWMKSLPQQKERRGFGAPWGFQWNADEALCLVAIRNLQWDTEGSRIGSGCGIVPQSHLDQEWRELFQKRLSVKKVLGLAT